MTKAELVELVASATKTEKVATKLMVEATIKTMCNAMANGHTLYIRGFGTMGPKLRKAKTARNIRKNEAMHLPEKYKVAFKPATELNNIVNSNLSQNHGSK